MKITKKVNQLKNTIMYTPSMFKNQHIAIQIDTISVQHGFTQVLDLSSGSTNREAIIKILSNVVNYKFGSPNCHVIVWFNGDFISFRYHNNPSEAANEVADYVMHLKNYGRYLTDVLELSNMESLVGKTIKWYAPASQENHPYSGMAKITNIDLNSRRPISAEILEGDDIRFAATQDGDVHYSDYGRSISFGIIN